MNEYIQTEWHIYNSYLTINSLHAIYNNLQAPATARESYSTACDIVGSPNKPWIWINCILLREYLLLI